MKRSVLAAFAAFIPLMSAAHAQEEVKGASPLRAPHRLPTRVLLVLRIRPRAARRRRVQAGCRTWAPAACLVPIFPPSQT